MFSFNESKLEPAQDDGPRFELRNCKCSLEWFNHSRLRVWMIYHKGEEQSIGFLANGALER